MLTPTTLTDLEWSKPDNLLKNALHIADEIADIAIYLSMLVHDLNLDLDAAVQRKLAINRERYPVEKAQGKSTKYDKL